MVKIVTLATCHNRVEKTHAALSSLHNQTNEEINFDLTHVIVDDASSDGTADMILNNFPKVSVVNGDGNLFWAGGMRLGWDNICRSLEFDYLFVYNDDVIFEPDAISSLLNGISPISSSQNQRSIIITGDFRDPNSGHKTYGGLIRDSKLNPLSFKIDNRHSKEPIYIDTLNMNGCLIGKDVLDKIGFLAPYFVHGGADLEFGLRASKTNGIKVLRLSKKIGLCERNPQLYLTGSVKDKLLKLCSEKCQPLKQRYKFYKKYGGLLWPYYFIRYYLKAFTPSGFNLKK